MDEVLEHLGMQPYKASVLNPNTEDDAQLLILQGTNDLEDWMAYGVFRDRCGVGLVDVALWSCVFFQAFSRPSRLESYKGAEKDLSQKPCRRRILRQRRCWTSPRHGFPETGRRRGAEEDKRVLCSCSSTWALAGRSSAKVYASFAKVLWGILTCLKAFYVLKAFLFQNPLC